ncbi:MAG: hypothetical protein WCC21_20685 [Candidatus Acidiferrales bacterium]
MLLRAAAFLLAVSAIVLTQARAQGTPGCGAPNVEFDVSVDKSRHDIPAPGPGKALVVFLQGDLEGGGPKTQFGVDGNWVGATSRKSYFYVSVDPGEVHVCSKLQTSMAPGNGSAAIVERALHFTAESGKTYFFGVYRLPTNYVLDRLDRDEVAILMSSLGFATSHTKK